MDIIQFLNITRKPWNIFTEEDHPEQLSSIYLLYSDIQQHFDLGLEKPLELVLTQSNFESQTQIVELEDKFYIILELQQISLISQLMEIFTFHEIDEESPISLFHALWVAEKYAELTGPVDGISVPLAIQFKVKEDLNDDLQDKFRSSRFTEHLCNLKGFREHFQICVAFIILHEMAHYHYRDSLSDGSAEKITRSIYAMPYAIAESSYLDEVIHQAASRGFAEHQIEELFCDFVAIQGTWKLCVERRFIDPKLFCFAFSSTFSSFYFFALSRKIYSREFYLDLRARHAYALSHGLFLNAIEDIDSIEVYETFITFVDVYCKNVVLSFSRSSLDVDIDKYKAALQDLLKLNFADYVPREHFDQISIDYLLDRIHELSDELVNGKLDEKIFRQLLR